MVALNADAQLVVEVPGGEPAAAFAIRGQRRVPLVDRRAKQRARFGE